MTNFQRWACTNGNEEQAPHFVPDPTGGWVSFEDHLSAVAENNRLRAVLAEARAELELAALRVGAPHELLRGMTYVIDGELR